MSYKEKAIQAVKRMMDYDGFRDGDCVSRKAVIAILDNIEDTEARNMEDDLK